MSFILKSLQKKQGLRRYIGPKRVLLLVCFVVFVYLVWHYYRVGALSPEIIGEYRDQHPVGAVLLFILIYAISVITSLPSLPFNLAGGFFWGGFAGGVYSTLGVTLGSLASFMVSRWLIGQPLAGKFDNKLVGKVQEEFENGGWKFVAFARINPIIPTGPFNYLLGLTSLPTKTFLWSTLVFLLPPSIAVAYIGDSLQTLTAQHAGVDEIVRVMLIASAAVTFLVGVKFASKFFMNKTGKK